MSSYTRHRPVIASVKSPSAASAALNASSKSAMASYRNKIVVVLGATVIYTAFLYRLGGARSFFGGSTGTMKGEKHLQIATWNIAAINNNPFEYWMSCPEKPDYEKLMVNVEKFIDAPGDKDVPVNKVFTEDMFVKLDKRLVEVGWKSMREYWDSDYSKRTIIGGFMKDDQLGAKRLASMPDRVTNTINTADGKIVFRPTVINMYEGDLSTQEIWWKQWEKFMFDDKLKIESKEGPIEEKIPYSMLLSISKAKYPTITEQEAEDSLPLQTLCGAIFDAILVHMMNTVSSPSVWQPLKKTMIEALNKKKVPHTLEILASAQYHDSDIITLQEVSASFVHQAKTGPLGKSFHIIAPAKIDVVRDQNSVICLNKETFPKGMTSEVSHLVEAAFPTDIDVPVSTGDILAITANSTSGTPFLIASFHGDTDGLATKPVLDAILKAQSDNPSLSDHHLIFGLDANTYENPKPGKQQDVMEWGAHYVEKGLTSCWGDRPDKTNYTTYNARTFLQPQLNKACRQTEKREKGDVNPKDFILFRKKDFTVVRTWKDNTGEGVYKEDMAFPTLQFPSDHGILATILEPASPATIPRE